MVRARAAIVAAVPLVAAAMAFAGAPAGAADAAAGRAKAQTCAQCHGALGVSQAPGTPHLAGQPESYLVAQLKAFRDGRRSHEVMSIIARSLQDSDIAELAAWFSSIEIAAREPK